ncbi:unnamed protein product, partial [Adineta steineri]
AITQGDHYSYLRTNNSASLFNLPSFSPHIAPTTTNIDSIEHRSDDK